MGMWETPTTSNWAALDFRLSKAKVRQRQRQCSTVYSSTTISSLYQAQGKEQALSHISNEGTFEGHGAWMKAHASHTAYAVTHKLQHSSFPLQEGIAFKVTEDGSQYLLKIS